MATTPTLESALPRRGKPWLRRLFYLLVVVLVSVGLAVLFGIWRDNARLASAIADADRHDPGWRLADIEAGRVPFPPEAQNSSLYLLTIRPLLGGRQWPTWPFPQFDNDPSRLAMAREAMDKSLNIDRIVPKLLDAEQERVLRAELKAADKAIAQARRLAELSQGRYPLKWDNFSTLLPHVDAARLVVTMLRYDGLLRAHDEDTAGALQNVKGILQVARALGDEPFLVTQGFRLWTDRNMMELLERILAHGQVGENDLHELQNSLTCETETPAFLTAMRGERAADDACLEHAQAREIPFRELSRAVSSLRRPTPPPAPGWSTDLAAYRDTLRFYAGLHRLRAALLERGTALVKIAQLPTKDQLQALEALGTEPLAANTLSLYFMTSSLGGYEKKLLTNDLRHKARFRSAQAALAAERFRLAQKRWPTDLEELVPTYLAAVPEDPFTGDRLRSARKHGSLIIYSVGRDLVDNGGTLTTEDGEPDEPDVGFILYDPEWRRHPAKPLRFPPRQ